MQAQLGLVQNEDSENPLQEADASCPHFNHPSVYSLLILPKLNSILFLTPPLPQLTQPEVASQYEFTSPFSCQTYPEYSRLALDHKGDQGGNMLTLSTYFMCSQSEPQTNNCPGAQKSSTAQVRRFMQVAITQPQQNEFNLKGSTDLPALTCTCARTRTHTLLTHTYIFLTVLGQT